MMNNFFSMLDPKMQQGVQSLYQQAQASGNPQQFLIQRYGKDPMFAEGLKIFNEQGIEGLNKFLTNKFNH